VADIDTRRQNAERRECPRDPTHGTLPSGQQSGRVDEQSDSRQNEEALGGFFGRLDMASCDDSLDALFLILSGLER